MTFLTPFLLNSLLFLILIMISVKDIREGLIPDRLLVLMGILGLVRFGGDHWISVVILGVLSYGLYKLYPFLKNQEWLGFGDVKMMTVSGLWLDISQIPLFLMLGGGIGIGIALLWWRVTPPKLEIRRVFPLGPALALSLGICIVGNNGVFILFGF